MGVRNYTILCLFIAGFVYVIAQEQRSIPPKRACKDKVGEGLSEAKQAMFYFNAENHAAQWREAMALTDCKLLLELNEEVLTECYSSLSQSESQDNSTWSSSESSFYKTWVSSVMTNQATCLESLAEANVDATKYKFTNILLNMSKLSSDSLAFMGKISINNGRRELLENGTEPLPDYGHLGNDDFPLWVSKTDKKRVLQDSSIQANLTVAQDGSGDYITISQAIAAAPNKTSQRYTIYVKAGIYRENVDIGKSKINIMLVGDGIDLTIITGNRSVGDGYTTFNTFTLAVTGQNFIAKDITIENTSGPEKHQAVALRSGADLSVFYRCSFKGYQDTLYPHSMRQFYRECDVYGTVDFIFGNAAVVLQNCNLYARRPMTGQKNMFTAQGRVDPNQNTGISIHNCSILAADDLVPVQTEFKSYLGRPWKEYSRTVVMQSYINDLIDPKGWFEWSGDFALSTLYYGEYNNTGPGSPTDQRVTWPGYHVMGTTDANSFTVMNFIMGDAWIPSDVPYTLELL